MNKSVVSYVAKVYIAIFLIIVLSPFISVFIESINGSQHNPFDYARITDVDYRAVLVDEPDSEGKIVITERLTFDVHAASRSNGFWELWRDLPEQWIDGVKVHYKVNSVKQILPDGSEIIYEQSPKLYWDDSDYLSTNASYGPGKWYHSEGPYNENERRYECVLFYVDNVYREEMVFEIEYEMYNAVLKYNDCSDLYISLFSGDTINHLESYDAEILVPDDKMPGEYNYEVFTYGTNSNVFPVSESADKNPGYYTFSIDLDEDDLKFRPYNKYLEIELVSFGADKHIFAEYASVNDYTYDDVLDEMRAERKDYLDAPLYYKQLKQKVLNYAIFFSLIIILVVIVRDRLIRHKNVFFKPATAYKYFRDIPSDLDPKFAAFLTFCKHPKKAKDEAVYSALMLSLVRKKYIRIDETADKKDAWIKILYKPQNTGQTDLKNNFEELDKQEAKTRFKDIDLKNLSASQIAYLDITTPAQQTDSGNPTSSASPDLNMYYAPGYEPLTRCEQFYFNLLLRHASHGNIMMSRFRELVGNDYDYTAQFVKATEGSIINYGIANGYLQNHGYDKIVKRTRRWGTTFIILGIVSLFINLFIYFSRLDLAFGAFLIFGFVSIGLGIGMKCFAGRYTLLTQRGEDEYAKWRGLYNFLRSKTLIRERQVIELPLWEKFLVYASAFGISAKVIKAIKINCPYVEESYMLGNSYYTSRRYYNHTHSFRSSVRSATHTHSFGGSGGGYGGGFGFGGGGRGGGGGGGGH